MSLAKAYSYGRFPREIEKGLIVSKGPSVQPHFCFLLLAKQVTKPSQIQGQRNRLHLLREATKSHCKYVVTGNCGRFLQSTILSTGEPLTYSMTWNKKVSWDIRSLLSGIRTRKHKTERCREGAGAKRSLSAGVERVTTAGPMPAKIIKELKKLWISRGS